MIVSPLNLFFFLPEVPTEREEYSSSRFLCSVSALVSVLFFQEVPFVDRNNFSLSMLEHTSRLRSLALLST